MSSALAKKAMRSSDPRLLSTLVQKTTRSSDPSDDVEVRVVYILVMGLTGAGKSTFISVVTGNNKIAVGDAGVIGGGS